jgi:LemA protein
VQLKRRLDLIPNLVETVKGYATHERATFDAVISARNSAMSASATPSAQAAADTVITGALRQLFALSEAYPDLKANQGFVSLQEELSNTESRIAYAQQYKSFLVHSSLVRSSSLSVNILRQKPLRTPHPKSSFSWIGSQKFHE